MKFTWWKWVFIGGILLILAQIFVFLTMGDNTPISSPGKPHGGLEQWEWGS